MARQQPATQFKKTLTQGKTAPETRVFGKDFVMNAAEKCEGWWIASLHLGAAPEGSGANMHLQAQL